MDPELTLNELVQLLNVKQLKSVLKLHNIPFTSKNKKSVLQGLVLDTNIDTNVVINYSGLELEVLNKKLARLRKKSQPKTPKKTKPKKKSKKVEPEPEESEPESVSGGELEPEEVDEYYDSDE